jgi:hypothetical protein
LLALPVDADRSVSVSVSVSVVDTGGTDQPNPAV